MIKLINIAAIILCFKYRTLFCSKPFLFRCIPNFAPSTAENVFASSGAKTLAEEVIADLELAWKEILYMCLIALGKYSLKPYTE